jgi:uncharacterized protein YndB with AHSA1/START domain
MTAISDASVDISSTVEPIIIMTRMFDASREKVWEAFTKPEHVARWYGGQDFSNRVISMDVRPGGLWRHVMITPDGSELELEFVYVEVVKPSKLVWENLGHSDGKPSPVGRPTCRIAATLEDHGARTKWTMVARFHTMAERDLTALSGFTGIVAQGCEKLNEVAKRL